MYETTVFAIHGMCLDPGHSNDICGIPPTTPRHAAMDKERGS